MRRTAASVGRMLVTVGVLILLFVAYQLWGTGYFTDRAQRDLRHEFAQELQDNPTVASTTTSAPPSTTGTAPTTSTTVPRTTAPKVLPVLQEGDAVGEIRIPRIGVDKIIVQGTARDDLAQGPGHYPATPLPGQLGNVAIAGHRTTHSKPFYDLDQLRPGDDIVIQMRYGTFTYRMYQQLIVRPSDVSVVGPTKDAELTLTTCNPRYSARQRLVVKARLVVNRSTAPARATVPVKVISPVKSTSADKASLADSLSGDISSRTPTFVWGTITVLLGLLWWWGYRRWRHPLTWLGGVLPFLAVLIVFYVYLERLLPANF
jgi:sortase A